MARLPGLHRLRTLRRRLLAAWLDRRVPEEAPTVVLHRRRIYILPTRQGGLFAATLLALLLGSINYDTSLGLAATFLLAGIGLVGMHQAHANLKGLELRCGHAGDVFAGETLAFPVTLIAPGRTRYAVAVAGGDPLTVEPAHPAEAACRVVVGKRGRHAPGRFAVETYWPLGMFRVWSWIHPAVTGIAYPRPRDHGSTPPDAGSTDDAGAQRRSGDEEEFAGLRDYRGGDPVRRVAWRTYARTGELHVKVFDAEDGGHCWLDWDQLAGLGPEQRLEQLARWVVDTERSGRPYGLLVPGVRIAPDVGPQHYRECLRALALHGATED